MILLFTALAVAGDQDPLAAQGVPRLRDVALLCSGFMDSPVGGANWTMWYSAREWTDLRDVVAAAKGPGGSYLFGNDAASWGAHPELVVERAEPATGVPFPGCPGEQVLPPGTRSVVFVLWD